ncbi:MAG: Phage integrase family protein [Phycisphaerales bacterium]|nr:Phage integrase family protein [Phycisphaerales bacterium]
MYGLKAHNNGKFYKYFPPPVGTKYFGSWDDPEGADREYARWVEAQRAGVPVVTDPSEITLAEVADRFISFQEGRYNAGEIEEGQFKAYQEACVDNLLLILGGTTRVVEMTGHDLERFRKVIRGRVGGHQTTKFLGNVKAMLRWAHEQVRPPLISVPLHRDNALRRVGAKEIRREQRERHQKHGKPYFKASEVRVILERATNPLRAMVLLAVNAGLGQRDIGELEWSFLKLKRKRPLLDYVRKKYELQRQATLWPETIAALVELRDAPAARRAKPLDPDHADRVFITRWGRPYWYQIVRRTAEGALVGRPKKIEAISAQFTKLLKRIDSERAAEAEKTGEAPPPPLVRHGRNFRAFRRTFSTIADAQGDRNAKRRIMGQQLEAMDPHYVLEMPSRRLVKVTDYVRRRILRVRPERGETRIPSSESTAPETRAAGEPGGQSGTA